MITKVIKGGVLIDGTGRPPVKDAVVIIEGARITSVGRESELDVSKGGNIETIEAAGKTIIPGLIESHGHIFMNGEMISEFASSLLRNNNMAMAMKAIPRLKRLLEVGITTYRDGGSGWGWIEVALRDAINKGYIIGPRFWATGYHITVTGGHGFFLPPWIAKYAEVHAEQNGMECNGPDDWRKAARLNIHHGTDNIKVVASRDVLSTGNTTAAQPTLEELIAAIEEAHKMGKRAIAHASGPVAVKNAIKAGVDVLVHGFFINEECVEMIVKNNVFFEPTNLYIRVIKDKGKGKLPGWMIEKANKAWEDREKNFKMYLDKGIKISCGSDAGVPFVPQGDNMRELKMFVELGMSTMDAIITATKTAAEAIGIEDEVGTIEKGKLADIVLVDGNPLKNIDLLSTEEKIKMVMKNGDIVISR